jgi:hypothetical protein
MLHFLCIPEAVANQKYTVMTDGKKTTVTNKPHSMTSTDFEWMETVLTFGHFMEKPPKSDTQNPDNTVL